MEFTQKETQKYNGISAQDLKDFNERKIIFRSTQSSCLGSENAVLSLENEFIFYNKMKTFFKKMKASCEIKNYSKERKQTLFYKWLTNFLVENHKTNRTIKYVYEKTLLNELKEASIILYNQEINED